MQVSRVTLAYFPQTRTGSPWSSSLVQYDRDDVAKFLPAGDLRELTDHLRAVMRYVARDDSFVNRSRFSDDL